LPLSQSGALADLKRSHCNATNQSADTVKEMS
jgi:hypothetical protein